MSAAADLFAKEAPVAAPSYKQSLTTADAWRMTGRSFFAVEPHAPQVALALPDQHRGGSPLDEVVYYKIYRNNVWLANDAETPYDDVVGSALENVTYNYFLTAIYDDSSESTHSDTVQAAANMAPGAPTNVTAEPLGSSQMHITWTDPTLNADGTTCTDLANLAIYRNGTLLGTVNPGVQQYTDTPPEPTQFYTWTISGRDEIPNEGPGGSATGAVQSPWIQIPYEWIDIADVGTAVTNCDDCNEGPFPLGFTMPYWGNNYSDIRICSNGFASFTSTSNSLGNVAIPSAAQPNDALFGFWDDLDPAETGGQVLYYADAAEQRFVISWLNVQHYPSGNPITFQFVLTPDGGVVMNWQIVALTNLSTHGVENVDGTDGLQLSHLGVGDFIPTDGSAIQFWGERIPQGFLDGIVRQLSNNSPLADVLVTATNPTNTEAALTDATGHYILELDSGAYTVTFSKDGFCDSVRTNILIEEDQTTVLNVSLRNPVAQLSVTSIQHESGPGQLTSTTFDITNPGNCALDFTITDDQPWLSTDPATGSVAAGGTSEITVWFDANGMGIGEYEGELTLTHSATGSPITVPVDLFIADAAGNHEALPTEFALNGNYPNPFNAVTEIRYDVPQASFVTIMLYNVLGQEVRTLVNTTMDAGRHVALWDGRDERGVDMTSGLYLMRMVAADHVFTGKLMMLK